MKSGGGPDKNERKSREERLAAQLRANLARRKSQARERSIEETGKKNPAKPR